MPTVSVIMSVYNGEAYLAEAIESILGQSFGDFEFLIVDDGSQDASAEISRAYEKRDSRIRFLPLERNLGIAGARNHGMAQACGEYITIMDCDDISLPRRLEKQAAFLRAQPRIGAVGTGGRAMSADMSTLRFELKAPQRHGIIVFRTLLGLSFIYTTVMTRAGLLRAVGGYRADLRTSEERDLYWRLLWQTRTRFANLPDMLYLYRQHEQSMQFDLASHLEADRYQVRQAILRQLWGEAPPASIERFRRLAMGERLGLVGRRAVKADMQRLIEALIDKGIVEAGERPMLVEDMARRLEDAKPRLWRKFNAWRRYRLPWLAQLV